MFCLENNNISFKNTLYKNNQGIPTGENFSVSLANIALHFLTKKVNFLNLCYIYKRHIDDIIFYVWQTNQTLSKKNSPKISRS